MRTAAKSTIFVASLALAVGALTGCSGGQSVADACKIFADEATKITSDAQSAMTSAATDPQAAVTAFNDVTDKFDALGDKITNDKVKPAFTDLTDAYGDLGDMLETAAKDPAKAAESMTELTESMTKITDSAKKLQEVCS